MKPLTIIVFLSLLLTNCAKRAHDHQNCVTTSKGAEDQKENVTLLHLQLRNNEISNKSSTPELSIFPLRIRIIQKDTSKGQMDEWTIQKSIQQLNEAFEKVNFEFYIQSIDYIESKLTIEDLSKNGYRLYNKFSKANDVNDFISLYIFDYGKEFCEATKYSVSCRKVGGFSYILSNITNNIVVSKFDLSDEKLLAHEFGHFFGLYHTFERDQFGKDEFRLVECGNKGDLICDTPPDPGGVYEVYINYHTCEMSGLEDENGNPYKPIIQNYMSYYKPCYMKPYSFTDGQITVMREAAISEFRNKYRNKQKS